MAKEISGIALFPRLSENDVFYWPQELKKFDGVTVPLRWNHIQTPEAIVGQATFEYNEEDRQVLYRATIDNEEVQKEVDKGTYKVSIGASVAEPDFICHKDGQCAEAPILNVPQELSIVSNPGIPESSLNILEGKCTKLECAAPKIITSDNENVDKKEHMTQETSKHECDCAGKTAEQECPVGKVWDGDKCVDVPVTVVAAPEAKEMACPEGKVDNGSGECVDKPAEAAPAAENKDVTVNVNVPETKSETIDVDAIKTELKAQVLSEMKAEWTPKSQVKEGADVPDWKVAEAKYTPEFIKEGLDSGKVTMKISKEDWIAERSHNTVTEAVSTSGTIPGVKLSTDIIVIPGSNTFEPIRSMGQFEAIPTGENTAKFWTMDVASFGAITESTSTDITASTHTLTAIDVTCSPRGILQQVLKSQMEDFPAKFIETLKETMRLAAIKDEHNLIVQTIADTNSDFNDDTSALAAGFPAHISGEDGTFINDTTAEDTVGEFQKEGISTARRYLQERGHNPVNERVVAIISPRAYDSLINDSDISRFIQEGDSSITDLGLLSRYFGVEIMVSNELLVANNSYRNVVFVSGKAWALASQREMEIEMDKEIAGQYVNLVATHRIGVDELDKTAYAIVSSKQD